MVAVAAAAAAAAQSDDAEPNAAAAAAPLEAAPPAAAPLEAAPPAAAPLEAAPATQPTASAAVGNAEGGGVQATRTKAAESSSDDDSSSDSESESDSDSSDDSDSRSPGARRNGSPLGGNQSREAMKEEIANRIEAMTGIDLDGDGDVGVSNNLEHIPAENILATLVEGDGFGHAALTEDVCARLRKASCRALVASSCMCLTHEMYLEAQRQEHERRHRASRSGVGQDIALNNNNNNNNNLVWAAEQHGGELQQGWWWRRRRRRRRRECDAQICGRDGDGGRAS